MAQPAQPGVPGMPPPPAQHGADQAKKGGFTLFGGGAPKKKEEEANIAEFVGELNNIARRLRVIEERYLGLRSKTQVTDQNMLSSNKKLMTEIKTNQAQLDDFRKEMDDLKEKFKIMIQEIKECAKRNDVQILSKYINMWEPINFVTRNEMMKLVKDNVEAQFEDLNIRLQQEDYIKEQIRLVLGEMRRREGPQ
ncbi:MAG: hypothetical protein KJ574_01365 [Nanoarchaeota archaeon]|nr:hypothetical protein [Nanoarchaeota archaeon]